MHIKRRSPLLGVIGIILTAILFLITICTYRYIIYAKAQGYDATLSSTSVATTNVTEETSNNATYLSQSEEVTTQLQEQKSECVTQVQEEKTTTPSTKSYVNKTDFKSYMPYTTITDKTSKQYNLQQNAYTDENGLRCIDNKPMVAVGTGWGLSVGDIALITCANGNSFEVVIGDIKANRDTNSDNKTTSANNCRCEFIVDMSALNSTVKRSGNVAVLEEYSGYVINIEKIN